MSETTRADYVAAAMIRCPRCRAAVGAPCTELACRNGYRNCQFAVCSYRKELPEPHLERSVAAALAASPEVSS